MDGGHCGEFPCHSHAPMLAQKVEQAIGHASTSGFPILSFHGTLSLTCYMVYPFLYHHIFPPFWQRVFDMTLSLIGSPMNPFCRRGILESKDKSLYVLLETHC